MTVNIEDRISFLEKKIENIDFSYKYDEIGTVLSVGDGVATVIGLNKVKAGELVEFENNILGLALNLEENSVGVVIFGDYSSIKEGSIVKRTERIACINVGEGLLGRVINPFGVPMDERGDIQGDMFSMPLERKAPEVLFREPVNEPMQTGIKVIDSMIPIGRGQRELIIGDRQTGKTSIAIDTIINQKKFYEEGNPVYCIYVAIGQKASTIVGIINELEKADALKYTIIVASRAEDPASVRYYSPFTGAAIGEFFRDTGRNALVIYDDLSKQAVAYREVSLLLQRTPGREAYPGDIFYLHSRLLERAARINKNDSVAKNMNDLPDSIKDMVKGGGSLTALPIIETQDGSVSAYIPTNVISITDGQIYLESNLFNSGFRPAVNIGISVSRVGSAAQKKSMKKIAGTLKLFQAQFAELESFVKFGSDLDESTQKVIDRGRRNNEILKQGMHKPLSVGEQCSVIYLSMNGYLDDVEVTEVQQTEELFLNMMNTKHKDLIDKLSNGDWDDKIQSELKSICTSFSEKKK